MLPNTLETSSHCWYCSEKVYLHCYNCGKPLCLIHSKQGRKNPYLKTHLFEQKVYRCSKCDKEANEIRSTIILITFSLALLIGVFKLFEILSE